MKNVILIGMTGSFKTSAGKRAAEMLGLEFFDADDEYEKIYGKISDTFASEGEATFRARETEVLRRLVGGENKLISCGGGAILSAENREILRGGGTVIQLFATPETLYKRISGDVSRPVTSGKSLFELSALYEKRKPLYDETASYFIDNTFLSPDETARKIVGIFN